MPLPIREGCSADFPDLLARLRLARGGWFVRLGHKEDDWRVSGNQPELEAALVWVEAGEGEGCDAVLALEPD